MKCEYRTAANIPVNMSYDYENFGPESLRSLSNELVWPHEENLFPEKIGLVKGKYRTETFVKAGVKNN